MDDFEKIVESDESGWYEYIESLLEELGIDIKDIKLYLVSDGVWDTSKVLVLHLDTCPSDEKDKEQEQLLKKFLDGPVRDSKVLAFCEPYEFDDIFWMDGLPQRFNQNTQTSEGPFHIRAANVLVALGHD